MSQRAAMLTMLLLMATPLLAENSLPSFAAPGLEAIHGEELARMSAALQVPPPITRRHATKVRLNIEVREHTKQLADADLDPGDEPAAPVTHVSWFAARGCSRLPPKRVGSVSASAARGYAADRETAGTC
jgi:hypothetical protein